MEEDIDRIMRRTRRYWYEDGFVEIAIGLLFTLIGIWIYLQERLADDSSLLVAMSLGLVLFTVGGSFIVKWLVAQLKQRVTYTRTGYVEYDDKGGDRKGRWLIIAVALGLAFLTLAIPESIDNMGVVVGLLMAVVLIYLAYRSGMPRFIIAAGLALAAAFSSLALELSDDAGTALVFGVVGLSLLVGGALGLIDYLRRTRPPDKAAR